MDCIRERIWQNEDVAWWHAQNIFLFVEEEYLANHPTLKAASEREAILPFSLVHPKNYLRLQERCSRLETSLAVALDLNNRRLRDVLVVLPSLTWKALRRRISRALDWVRREETVIS